VQFLKAVLLLKEMHKYDPNPEAVLESHITLPGGVKWFTFSSSTLFVREFYNELFTNGFKRFANVPANAEDKDRYGNPSKFFVIGTPGIAKSSCGVYLVARALFMGKTVVYHPGKEKTPLPIVFNPLTETVEKVTFLPIDDAIIPELKNPDTVYISDSHEPETVDAWTATITSPRRDRWYEKSKDINSRLVFFPAFTWNEIQEFSNLRLANASKEEIAQRFLQWGGNVRYVCMAQEGMQSKLLANAIKAITGLAELSELATFTPEKEQRDNVAHRIMHFEINRDIDSDPDAWVDEGKGYTDQDKYLILFDFRRIFIPTEYIRSALTQKIQTAAWREKIRLAIQDNTFQDSGGLFALCVTKVLTSMNDTLTAIAIGHGGPDIEVHLQEVKPVHFLDVEDLKLKLEARATLASSSGGTAAPMLLPVDKTFPGADAVLDSRTFLQFTMNLEHKIAWASPSAPARQTKNFRKRLCELGYENEQGDIRLIVVVPAGVQFTSPMSFVSGSKAIDPSTMDPLRNMIKQYVIYLDLAKYQ
jgi:hypothetical protein